MIFGEWDMNVAKEVWQEETMKRTVQNMLKEGLDLALIARYTELPEKEILALR